MIIKGVRVQRRRFEADQNASRRLQFGLALQQNPFGFKCFYLSTRLIFPVTIYSVDIISCDIFNLQRAICGLTVSNYKTQ